MIFAELFVDSSEDLPEIGRLEFELSQEYVSFLEAAIDIMFTAHSSSTTTGDVSVSEDRRKQSHVTLNSTPVLLPYAKQVEKQLYAGSSSEQKGTDQGDSLFMAEKGKYVDDLMVPSMRHFLQQCISRKALGNLFLVLINCSYNFEERSKSRVIKTSDCILCQQFL